MMERIFQQSYHIPGTLSANITIKFTSPVSCTLLHVSAVASNASDATLKIGTSSDDDEFLVAATIGVSGTPKEFDRDDFVGTQYPRIEDGDVVIVTLDYDGSSGTAAQNVTLLLTFAEG
jgi:hypothetical protein